jgi:anionic cell wall polymer biosynthesis LytR-Cps2A-Psr (LCP) family protein
VKDGVEGATGLKVQYYTLIDMRGFEQLIDAMGGIEVDVKKRVPKAAVTDRRATAFIEPGRQRLNGADALWFARSRFESSDYERMARQRCVMSAMAAQLDPQTLLLRFQDIASAGAGVVSTDVPEADLGGFVDLALKTKAQPITGVQLVPPAIDTSDPDYDVAHQLVAAAVAASEAAGGTASAVPQDDAPATGDAAPAPDAGEGEDGGAEPADEAPTEEAPVAPEQVCTA